jgi:hypothetical protein
MAQETDINEVQKNNGCEVIQDDRVRDNCESLFEGKFSLRGYFGVDFEEIYNGCDNPDVDKQRVEDCVLTVRRGVRRIEDGRFVEAMNGLDKLITELDDDEVEEFEEKFPNLIGKVEQVSRVEQGGPPGDMLD